jgi:glycosyltransferase involved in cell wall biosynthesis
MISIVIPVFNEAAMLRPAVEELSNKLDALAWDYEIVLAENGSTDGSGWILEKLRGPRVRVLRQPQADYGRALRRGIRAARGDVVICDEIDLCDVDFYRRALPLLASGTDLVVGSKAMAGAEDRRPLFRRIATRIITMLLRLTTGFRGTDTHGLKAFRRLPLLSVVRACVMERDLFASELVIRAQRMGRALREIPVALEEKRPPGIHLWRRVPRVLGGLLTLAWQIRVRRRGGALLAGSSRTA